MDDCGCPQSTSKLQQNYFHEGMTCHCPLLILPIFYSPSLSIPSYYCGLSLCSSLPYVTLIFFKIFFSPVTFSVLGLSAPIFFWWFLLPTMWVSISILLLGVLWLVFISCSTGQAASSPVWSWVGALGRCPARERSWAQSSLRARRKITGAGFVSGWFTDIVTIQALVQVSVHRKRLQPGEPEERSS